MKVLINLRFLIMITISCTFDDNSSKEIITKNKILYPIEKSIYYESELVSLVSKYDGVFWYSSKDGYIGNSKNVSFQFSSGPHIIHIEDTLGNELDFIEIFIKELVYSYNSRREVNIINHKTEILLDKGTYYPSIITGDCKITNIVGNTSDTNLNLIKDIRIPFNKKLKKSFNNTSSKRNSVTLDNYEVGIIKDFKMPDIRSETTSAGFSIKAKLVYQNESLLLWEDCSNDCIYDYSNIITNVNENILKKTNKIFGDYSDVNGDNKLSILFSEKINKSDLAIGFFNPNDLFPFCDDMSNNNFNPHSNLMDILYIGIPDNKSFAFTEKSILATISHELTHLIHFNNKTFKKITATGTDVAYEETFLEEGVAHLSETLCGYGVTGGNILFIDKYLKNTNYYSLVAEDYNGEFDSVGKRGGNCLFFYYLLEKSGGFAENDDDLIDNGGLSFINRLITSDYIGINCIEKATGRSYNDLLREFANYMERGTLGEKMIRSYDLYTGELNNFPLILDEITVYNEIKVKLDGIRRISIKENNLVPYSILYCDKIVYLEKSKFNLKINGTFSNLLFSLLML